MTKLLLKFPSDSSFDVVFNNRWDELGLSDNLYSKMFQGCQRLDEAPNLSPDKIQGCPRLDEVPNLSPDKIREDRKYVMETLSKGILPKDYYLYHRPSMWEKIKILFKKDNEVIER